MDDQSNDEKVKRTLDSFEQFAKRVKLNQRDIDADEITRIIESANAELQKLEDQKLDTLERVVALIRKKASKILPYTWDVEWRTVFEFIKQNDLRDGYNELKANGSYWMKRLCREFRSELAYFMTGGHMGIADPAIVNRILRLSPGTSAFSTKSNGKSLTIEDVSAEYLIYQFLKLLMGLQRKRALILPYLDPIEFIVDEPLDMMLKYLRNVVGPRHHNPHHDLYEINPGEIEFYDEDEDADERNFQLLFSGVSSRNTIDGRHTRVSENDGDVGFYIGANREDYSWSLNSRFYREAFSKRTSFEYLQIRSSAADPQRLSYFYASVDNTYKNAFLNVDNRLDDLLKILSRWYIVGSLQPDYTESLSSLNVTALWKIYKHIQWEGPLGLNTDVIKFYFTNAPGYLCASGILNMETWKFIPTVLLVQGEGWYETDTAEREELEKLVIDFPASLRTDSTFKTLLALRQIQDLIPIPVSETLIPHKYEFLVVHNYDFLYRDYQNKSFIFERDYCLTNGWLTVRLPNTYNYRAYHLQSYAHYRYDVNPYEPVVIEGAFSFVDPPKAVALFHIGTASAVMINGFAVPLQSSYPQLIACNMCDGLAELTCSRCDTAYCSSQCQSLDWDMHKHSCT
jgi:hypothetical protein